MIVVMMFEVDDELEQTFKKMDLQGGDYATYVNNAAKEWGYKRGAWHFWNASEKQIGHAIGTVFKQMEGGKT